MAPSLGRDAGRDCRGLPRRRTTSPRPVPGNQSDRDPRTARGRLAVARAGRLPSCWLVQQRSAGQSRPSSATTIVPAFQQLEIGQWVPMSPSPTPSDRTALKVHSFELNRWLLWSKPESTWAWRLTPTADRGTRLVTRIRAVYDWRHPLTAFLGVVLMEFGDFAMQRRMLRGIKARAESPDPRAEPAARR